MLSHTCKTAIKAVIYLAAHSGSGKKASIKEIAEQIDANEHTVGKLLQTLVRRRIINSTKGPAGGFFLSESQQLQPIMAIVEAIDGQHIFYECGLGLSQCSDTHPCPLHDQYKVPRDLLKQLFEQNTIADLCQPIHEGLAYLIA